MDEQIQGHIITKERMAKGDMDGQVNHRGYISTAQVKDTTILATLIQHGHLETYHRSYADDWLEMREAFRRPVSNRTMQLNGQYAPGLSDNDTLYLKVCRRMGKDNEGLVLHALTQPIRLREVNDYVVAFDALVSSVDESRAEMRGGR